MTSAGHPLTNQYHSAIDPYLQQFPQHLSQQGHQSMPTQSELPSNSPSPIPPNNTSTSFAVDPNAYFHQRQEHHLQHYERASAYNQVAQVPTAQNPVQISQAQLRQATANARDISLGYKEVPGNQQLQQQQQQQRVESSWQSIFPVASSNYGLDQGKSQLSQQYSSQSQSPSYPFLPSGYANQQYYLETKARLHPADNAPQSSVTMAAAQQTAAQSAANPSHYAPRDSWGTTPNYYNKTSAVYSAHPEASQYHNVTGPPNCRDTVNQRQQQQFNQTSIPQLKGVSSSDNGQINGALNGSTRETTASPDDRLSKVETLTKNTNSRIDPAFVPRPLYSTEPISQPGGKRFETNKYTIPPPPFGVYTVVDRGSASCRFIRASLNQLPTASQTLKSAAIPLVISSQPFPVMGQFEEAIPVVNLNKGSAVVSSDSDTEGPPRCPRCHAYISPFMTSSDDSSILCNFCGHTSVLPKHYQYALAEYSRLRNSQYKDADQVTDPNFTPFDRYEIVYGTVDFVAPSSFLQIAGTDQQLPHKITQNDPTVPSGELQFPPPSIVFVIDTSASAQQCGLTQCAIAAIRYVLAYVQHPRVNICISTFDQTIKFYPLSHSSETSSSQEVLVVTDIGEPFSPAHSSQLFCEVGAGKELIDAFLEELPTVLAMESQAALHSGLPLSRSESCGNAALKAAVELLHQQGGGSVKIFYGASPDIGIGTLQKMNLATPSQKDSSTYPLHPPEQLADFYSDLLWECLHHGVAVDVFVASMPNRHVGVSSLGYISRRTGGQCRYYGNFDIQRDYNRFCMDLMRQIQLPQAYDCIVKLRCSRGFSVSKLLIGSSLGKKDPKIDTFADPSTFRIPRIDADKALMFELKHDGDVPEDSRAAYFQIACLHTTVAGLRRIRVITLGVSVTSSLSTTFRYSEVESALAYFVRKSASLLMSTPQAKWKEEMLKQLVEILFSYRLNCAANTSAGQLILPDALKSLPVYISGLFKHAAFRSTTDVFSDDKDFLLQSLLDMPLHQLIISVYPRLYVLHRSYSQMKGEKLQRIGSSTGMDDEIYLPPVVASSGEKITTDGLFLLDNEICFYLYCGMDVNFEILKEIFGTAELTDELTKSIDCENLSGKLGMNINKTIQQIRKTKGLGHPWQPIVLVRPRTLQESQLTWLLVEDRLGSESSYVDFLCQLHKSVHHKMEEA